MANSRTKTTRRGAARQVRQAELRWRQVLRGTTVAAITAGGGSEDVVMSG